MTKYKANKLNLDDKFRAEYGDGEFIALPSCNTHYKCEGGSGEWCVLVHGYATPLFIYDKIAESLTDNGYRVLRYDLVGRGLSERVKKIYAPQLFVKQLDELTSALLGGESFFLVGTSMGGTITAAYTGSHPEKVKKLVLLAPAGMEYDAPFFMKLAKIKGVGELLFNTFGAKFLTKGCAKELIYSGEAVKLNYMEKFAYCTQFKGMMRATLSSLRNTILDFDEAKKGYDALREAGTDVLVIWGDADRTMPYYQAERMKKLLPNMKLITYEGSGHIFLYDEGSRASRDVLEFLRG